MDINVKIDYKAMLDASYGIAKTHLDLADQYQNQGNFLMEAYHNGIASRLIHIRWTLIRLYLDERGA